MDDSPVIRVLVTASLEALGYSVKAVDSGHAALAAIAYLSPVEFESNQPWAAAQQPRALTQPSCP